MNLSQSTAISVEGANQGISNVELKLDSVIGGLPQIEQGVAQVASDGPIITSSLTRMEQRILAIESITTRILPDFHTKIDQLPLRIQETLGESTLLAGQRPSVGTPGLNSVISATSTAFTNTVLFYNS